MAGFGNMEFVTFKISPEEKKDYDKWADSCELSVDDVLNKFGGDGFKMSLKYVADVQSWVFTVIGTDVTKAHKNQAMSSWSDMVLDVVLVAAYKHYVMCDGGGWPENGKSGLWG